MPEDAADPEEFGVLQSKRNATQYQILVRIAERQPAVNQQERADTIGTTARAVSDCRRDPVEDGYPSKHGRGRYEVIKKGVDRLISRTDALCHVIKHVSEDIAGQVETETGVTTAKIIEGEALSPTMQDGGLRPISGGTESATAVAVTNAEAADPESDIRFGSACRSKTAARGLDTPLLSSTELLPAHINKLRDQSLDYEVAGVADI